MKKSIVYVFLFLLLFFILPAILTNTDKNKKSNDNETKENSLNSQNINNTEEQYSITENIEYTGDYATIKLLNHNTGIVEDVKLEEYLINVVSAEMPANFELEALKAQALVARTYTIHKVKNKKHDNADICTNFACCQAWISKEDRFARWDELVKESNWNKIQTAVNETVGKIVTYNNKPINAFFHSNSGGITEIPVNVWGGTGYPYLQVIETSGEDVYSQYASKAEFTSQELLNKLKKTYRDIEIDFNNVEDIKILEYTDSDRVKTIKFGNKELSGTETRTLLGLRSTNFEVVRQDGKIIFSVTGYGHGVGMSQTGADALAKKGYKAEEIIHHFYKDVEIKEINNIKK